MLNKFVSKCLPIKYLRERCNKINIGLELYQLDIQITDCINMNLTRKRL